MLTYFRRQVVVAVHQQVVAVVVRQRVVVVHRPVVAVVVHQQVVVAALEQAAVVVPLAFAGKILQTELRLPLQVAITFSFHLPPNKFCFYII